MRRSVPALLVVAVLLAGCSIGGPASSDDTTTTATLDRTDATAGQEPTTGPVHGPQTQTASSPVMTPTDTVTTVVDGPATRTVDSSPTTTTDVPQTSSVGETRTATGTETSTEYVLRRGNFPSEFGSINATFRIVFVEQTEDLGPCYDGVLAGPYKPTLTPLPTPAGDCHLTGETTVDLTAIDGDHSLGTFTVPPGTEGHALVATDVDATYENGTHVKLLGTGGWRFMESPARPGAAHGVEIGAERGEYENVMYDYVLVSESFDSSG